MPALVTNELRQVLNQQQPESVRVVMTSHPDNESSVAQELTDRGISFEQQRVGDGLVVFEGTIPSNQINSISDVGGIRQIDLATSVRVQGGDTATITARQVDGISARSLTDSMSDINIKTAWDTLGTKGSGVKVGVIDTTIDADHPAIKHAIADIGGPKGEEDHATWVTGAIASRQHTVQTGPYEGMEIHGAAPDVEIYGYAALAGGKGGVIDISKGVNYCIDQGVDIINMSFGGPHNTVYPDLLAEMEKNDILPVVSAGNAGPSKDTLTCPGHHKEPVTVASVGRGGDVSVFSSRGPGWTDARQKPDVAAPGGDTELVDGQQRPSEGITGPAGGGSYTAMYGTSMAAPHVAGLAALKKSATITDGAN